MKGRQMTAAQRECPPQLIQWWEDAHGLGSAPDRKAPLSAGVVVHPLPAQGRACACTFPRKPTHQSSLRTRVMSFNEDEDEDDIGGKDVNQGNNSSNKETMDSDSKESD